MKKLLYLLLILPLFMSCSSSDDDTPTQDYTSFEIFTNEDVTLTESVIGYYTSDGSCKKLVDLGTLTKGVHSKEVIVDIDTLKNIYFFSDYPRISTKFDTIFVLKKNTKNIFEIKDYTKGIRVDKTDPTQYPQ